MKHSALLVIGWSATILLMAISPASAQTQCKLYFSVVFQDPAKKISHGLSAEEQDWLTKVQKKYPGICYSDPPHKFYRAGREGEPPVLDGELIYPNVAAEIAPLVFYVTSSPRTYHGTKTQTSTTRTAAPVSGTATDSRGEVYQVDGTADITTTTTQEVPYSVDYENLFLLVQQKQLDGTWRTLRSFDRRTLCPALYGVCVGNRHPYQKLLEQGVKWIFHNKPQTMQLDFRPE